MMVIVNPGELIRLWIFYQENGEKITGLTDLSLQIRDKSGNIIISSESLTESVNVPGDYYYNWNTNSMSLETTAVVYYKKGSDVIYIEEYYFDIQEDADGRAM